MTTTARSGGQHSTGPPLIDLDPVRLIHRAPDSYIAFGAKPLPSPLALTQQAIPARTWQDLFSLPADSLRSIPADALQLLGTDAYFSLNGMYRGGHGWSKAVPSLPRAFRRTNGLRYLNVAYTDLDAHKAGADAPRMIEQAIQEAASMQKAGTIPPPSIIVRSGRGAWLLWLLSDDATRLPPRSTAGNLRAYRDIQSAIQRRVTHLGADPLAVDAVRMARVPGSVHSSTGGRVAYEAKPGPGGTPPLYTLAELAEAFGASPTARQQVPAAPIQARPRSTKAGTGEAPSGGFRSRDTSSGWGNVNRSRLRQLDQLQTIRGGFSEGCRNFSALLLATTLHGLGKGSAEISERVSALAAACRPPLPDSECKAAIKSGTSGRYRFRNSTISNGLGISPAEAEQLETWEPAGASHALAGTHNAAGSRGSSRKKTRHRLIILLVQEGGGVVPSIRLMAKLLSGRGQKVGRDTIHRDYKALDLGTGESEPLTPGSSSPSEDLKGPKEAA